MSRNKTHAWNGTALLLLLAVVAVSMLLPLLAAAQQSVEDGAGPAPSAPFARILDMPSAARSQDLVDPVLFGLFLVETVFTLSLAALIAFHPVRRRTSRTSSDRMLPKLFLFYSLIGMTIGFLVVQHGYPIGFVIFGIGGLLRFRSSLGSPSITVEMIMVTVIGLCVGLNLSVVALMITLAVWGVLWITESVAGFEVRLQCESEGDVQRQLDRLSRRLRDLRWPLISINRSTTKPGASVLFRAGFSEDVAGVEREIAAVLDDEGATWKVKT